MRFVTRAGAAALIAVLSISAIDGGAPAGAQRLRGPIPPLQAVDQAGRQVDGVSWNVEACSRPAVTLPWNCFTPDGPLPKVGWTDWLYDHVVSTGVASPVVLMTLRITVTGVPKGYRAVSTSMVWSAGCGAWRLTGPDTPCDAAVPAVASREPMVPMRIVLRKLRRAPATTTTSPAPARPRVSAPAKLPATGQDSTPLAVAAGSLVLIGVVLRRVSRRAALDRPV